MTFQVGRTHDLLNAEQVAADKHISLRCFPDRAESFHGKLEGCLETLFFSGEHVNGDKGQCQLEGNLRSSFRSGEACVYLQTQVDYYISQQGRVCESLMVKPDG